MTEQEFKVWVIGVIGRSSNRLTIRKRLRDNGFKFLASGSYKVAYRHPKHPKHVVKVYREDGDAEEDSPSDVPEDVGEFYLHPIHRTDNYMIQAFANSQGGSRIQAYRWFRKNTELEMYDLHSGNCRYHNGKPVIIDFCS